MEGDVYFEMAGCMCKNTFTSTAYAAYATAHIRDLICMYIRKS